MSVHDDIAEAIKKVEKLVELYKDLDERVSNLSGESPPSKSGKSDLEKTISKLDNDVADLRGDLFTAKKTISWLKGEVNKTAKKPRKESDD